MKTIESYTTDVRMFQNYLLEKDVDPEIIGIDILDHLICPSIDFH
ncbi:hypothetical protein ACQKMV_00840 [Lysinibacillus sp. NPDC094403]